MIILYLKEGGLQDLIILMKDNNIEKYIISIYMKEYLRIGLTQMINSKNQSNSFSRGEEGALIKCHLNLKKEVK